MASAKRNLSDALGDFEGGEDDTEILSSAAVLLGSYAKDLADLATHILKKLDFDQKLEEDKAGHLDVSKL